MRKLLSCALVGVALAMTAGAASAQNVNRDYSDMLKKGKGAEIQKRERVTQAPPPVMRQTVVALEDQFPEQGADNPSGLLSNGDWNAEEGVTETRIGSGVPITQENQVSQLDPQEVPPLYRRGGGARVQ